MSKFDNFDIHQMSPKLAQRWHFVCNFYCKKIIVLGSLDYAINAKRHLFFGHPISTTTISTTTTTTTTTTQQQQKQQQKQQQQQLKQQKQPTN